MAKYRVEYDPAADEVTKTLTFMEKEYSEVWKEEASYCECSMEALVEMDHADLPEEVTEALQEITSTYTDEYEMLEHLQVLTQYEQSL